VNKVETRVELLFEYEQSAVLSEEDKARIREVLDNRINKEGILIISADNHRSQLRNKKEAMSRFDELITQALQKRKKRKAATSFRAHPNKRLTAKKQQSEKKALRGKVEIDRPLD
jgi:ribosome-associated protein